MRVAGVSRSGVGPAVYDQLFPVTRLNDALAEADFVVAALPDTPATHHLLSTDAFTAMRRCPLIFNVGRGNTLHESALLEALAQNQIRGAVLDVFDTEPLPQEHPYWQTPNISITPHIAAVSYPADIAKIFLTNLAKFRRSEPLDYLIDPTRGY